MQHIVILKDDVIIVTGVGRFEALEQLRAYLKEDGHGDIAIIGFGAEEVGVLDAREAPPEITEAARLIDTWLKENT